MSLWITPTSWLTSGDLRIHGSKESYGGIIVSTSAQIAPEENFYITEQIKEKTLKRARNGGWVEGNTNIPLNLFLQRFTIMENCDLCFLIFPSHAQKITFPLSASLESFRAEVANWWHSHMRPWLSSLKWMNKFHIVAEVMTLTVTIYEYNIGKSIKSWLSKFNGNSHKRSYFEQLRNTMISERWEITAATLRNNGFGSFVCSGL